MKNMQAVFAFGDLEILVTANNCVCGYYLDENLHCFDFGTKSYDYDNSQLYKYNLDIDIWTNS